MNVRLVSARIHQAISGTKGGARRSVGILVAASLPLLGGCSSVMAPSAPAPAPAQVSITADELVGKWGLAAYRVETDLARTQAEAKRACSNPYIIGKGATGGVTMHLADQPVAQEVILKSGADGRVYIGPQNKPPGDRLDRQVLSYGDGVLVAQWVDPAVATRYGTMVFVRCSGA